METTISTFDHFPHWVLKKWQDIADLLAEIIGIPAALIMKTENESMEVFISSHSENNPYTVGRKESWHGLYGETVIRTQNRLLVTNALKDSKWDKNPDIKLGMIAYLGFPLNFPDNQPFGTLCVLDHKERPFTLQNEKLIRQFKNDIELDLALLQAFELKTSQLSADIVREIADRKQAEDKLRLKNFVFDVSIVAKSIAGINGTITEVNNSFLRVWGYQGKNEVIGKPISLFIKDHDEAMTIVTALNNTGKWEGDFIGRKKDGSTFIAQGLATVVKDEVGEIIAHQSAVFDITQRRKTEAELEESREKYRGLSKAAFESIFISEKGICIEQNQSAENMFGYTSEEAIGRYGTEWIAPQDREMVMQHMLEGYEEPYEGMALKKDGTTFPCILRGKMMHYKGRTVRVTSLSDNTYRKQAEDKLKVSEQLYRNLFDQASEGLILLTMDGKIAELNHSFAQMHGYTVDEMKNMDIKELDVLREGAFDGRAAVMQRIYDGEVVRFEVEHYHKKGHSFFLSDTVSLITIAGQQYFLAFHQDITERKLAESELVKAKGKAEESDRLKTAFLLNMSHEIRTPLNGILGFSELLSEPGLESEEQQKYIKLIQKSGDRMLNIISEIMDISKIESGQVVGHFQKTNINQKIENVYKLLKPDAENKKVHLFFKNSLPADEAFAVTDEDKLYAILTNLVKNAIKYTDKGSIEFGYEIVETRHAVESRHLLPLLQFYVKDTGIGIPKDRQEAIFERFIQADIVDVQARQGAGLGLSIAKAFVEMLGGEIRVESEQGKGSIFYFTLPYNTERDEKNAAAKVVPDESEENHNNPEVSGLKY